MDRVPDNFLEIGKSYSVKPIKFTSKGIIVHISDTSYTAFIHISKLSNEFVTNVASVVKLGQIYEAKCVRGNFGAELSLKHLNLSSSDDVGGVSDFKPQSLDDMIFAANSTLKDKQSTSNKLRNPNATTRQRKRQKPE